MDKLYTTSAVWEKRRFRNDLRIERHTPVDGWVLGKLPIWHSYEPGRYESSVKTVTYTALLAEGKSLTSGPARVTQVGVEGKYLVDEFGHLAGLWEGYAAKALEALLNERE